MPTSTSSHCHPSHQSKCDIERAIFYKNLICALLISNHRASRSPYYLRRGHLGSTHPPVHPISYFVSHSLYSFFAMFSLPHPSSISIIKICISPTIATQASYGSMHVYCRSQQQLLCFFILKQDVKHPSRIDCLSFFFPFSLSLSISLSFFLPPLLSFSLSV